MPFCNGRKNAVLVTGVQQPMITKVPPRPFPADDQNKNRTALPIPPNSPIGVPVYRIFHCITLFAVLLHQLAGCCLHHVHAHEVGVQQASNASEGTSRAKHDGHANCRHHCTADNHADSSPADHTNRHDSNSSCEGGRCDFVPHRITSSPSISLERNPLAAIPLFIASTDDEFSHVTLLKMETERSLLASSLPTRALLCVFLL